MHGHATFNMLVSGPQKLLPRCVLPGPRTSIVHGHCVLETSVKRRYKIVQEVMRNVANVSSFYAIIAIMVFQWINIRQVPWEVLKISPSGLGFKHLPRDLANVNAWKTMFDPYIESTTACARVQCETSAWPSHYCTRLRITMSMVRITLETEFSLWLYGAVLLSSFVVSIWLKIMLKER